MSNVTIVKEYDTNYIQINNRLLTVETVGEIFKNLISPVELYVITREVCSEYQVEDCDTFNIGVKGDDRTVMFVMEDILSILFDLYRDRIEKSMIFDTNRDNNWFIQMIGDVYEEDDKIVGSTSFYLIGVSNGASYGINSLSLADILSRKFGRYVIQPDKIEQMFTDYVERYTSIISGNIEYDPSELIVSIRYDNVNNVNSGTIEHDFDTIFKMYKEFIGNIIRKVFY